MLGAIAGYFGGIASTTLIMRICDAVLSFPSIILAMAIAAARGGPGLANAMIAVIIVLWPEYARLMRGQVLTDQGATSTSPPPNRSGRRSRASSSATSCPAPTRPIVVKATLDVGSAIVLTAGLSFIGIGAVPPTAEWGAMINQGAQGWTPILVVLHLPRHRDHERRDGAQLLRRRLRDALDPRSEGVRGGREDGKTGEDVAIIVRGSGLICGSRRGVIATYVASASVVLA